MDSPLADVQTPSAFQTRHLPTSEPCAAATEREPATVLYRSDAAETIPAIEVIRGNRQKDQFTGSLTAVAPSMRRLFLSCANTTTRMFSRFQFPSNFTLLSPRSSVAPIFAAGPNLRRLRTTAA